MRLLKPLNSSHLRWLHLKLLTSLKWLHLSTELVSHYHNCLSQKRLKIDKKHTWWKSSMSISASAFHDFSSETQKRCKASTREMTYNNHAKHKALLLTRGILVKYDFGVFKKVFSNDEDLLSTPHWTAVQWLFQYFRHSCWLGCKHSRYTSCIYVLKFYLYVQPRQK